MVSKSTSILMAIGIVAVAAVAIIGLGYAYTATLDNTGNDASVKYLTLDSSGSGYVGAFDKEIKYDTGNVGGTITYTLTDGQEVTIISGETPVKGVSLGTVTVTVGKSTGNTDTFKFCVKDTTGTVTPGSGSFYIKINDVVRAYTPGSFNYYKTGSDAAAVTSAANGTAFATDTSSITVELFYAFSTGSTTTAPSYQPLSGVTFQFKAEPVEAA